MTVYKPMGGGVQDSKLGSSYYFPGATTDRIENVTAPAIDTAFTIISSCVPASFSSGWHGLAVWGTGTNRIIVGRNADAMRIYTQGTNKVNVVNQFTATDLGARTYAAQCDGTNFKLYRDGVLLSSAAGSMLSTGLGYAVGCTQPATNGETWDGKIARTLAFNYSISEDKVKRYSAGAKLDFDDIGGSMVEIVGNTNFESDTIGAAPAWWSINNGTVTVQAAPGTGHGTKSLRCVGVANGGVGVGIPNKLTIGKRYRVSFWVYGTAGETYRCTFGTNTAYTLTATNVWEKATFEFIADTTYIYAIQTQVFTGTFYLDDISCVQLGAVLDLEPENITDTTWVDASPNGLHGVVSGALASRFIPSYSSKNYLINGGFDFSQRYGAGVAVINAVYAATYVADRWFHTQYDDGVVNEIVGIQTLAATSSGNAIRINPYHPTIFNPGYSRLCQIIEYINVRPLVGKLATFSISHRVPTGSPYSGEWVAYIRYDTNNSTLTSASAATTKMELLGSGVASAVIRKAGDTSTSWTKSSLTFTVPSDARRLAIVLYAYNATNNAFVEFSDAMLNEGSVAAPFERAGGNIQQELALCQRYYEKSYDIGTAITSNTSLGLAQGMVIDTTSLNRIFTKGLDFSVRKRAIPTIYSWSQDGTPSNVSLYGNSATKIGISSYDNTMDRQVAVYITLSSNGVAGTPYVFHWAADAEL